MFLPQLYLLDFFLSSALVALFPSCTRLNIATSCSHTLTLAHHHGLSASSLKFFFLFVLLAASKPICLLLLCCYSSCFENFKLFELFPFASSATMLLAASMVVFCWDV